MSDHTASSAPAIIHMIGNAHLDPTWMWEWGEGMEAFIATCRSALDRMDEFPGFVFSCSSAAHYQWIELIDPELFARIGERVDEGRWEIVGGWWTQADCNIPSGEGFVRQALLAQHYFLSRFGCMPRIGYSPDAFGHSAGLPQILRHTGLDSYIFCRPDPSELTLPSPLFDWQSRDGSTVMAYRVPFHYNMYQTTVRKKVADLNDALDGATELTGEGRPLRSFANEWALFYGVGNHGGGPTKEHIRTIEEIESEGEVEITCSRLDAFLTKERAAQRDARPLWTDDLQLNAPGCYSVHSTIKQLNRRAEYELLRAETMLVMANGWMKTSTERDQTDRPASPWLRSADDLRRAWENVCFNHFHDILCGVAIEEGMENAVHRYGESLTIADRLTRFALRTIASRIDTRGEGMMLVVVNPYSFEYTGPVPFELWHDIDKELWKHPIDLAVTDMHGEEVPVQQVPTSGKIGRDRIGATFNGTVPPFGWRCWRVQYGRASRYASTFGLIDATATVLENEHLRVEFSENSGGLIRLLDKRSGLLLIDANDTDPSTHSALPTVIADRTDTWGHGVDRFDQVIGRFGSGEVRLIANGPTHGTIRTVSRHGSSWMEQEFTLYVDSPILHVRARLFQTEPETMIKLPFHTTLEKTRTVVESGFQSVEKPTDGTERPGGKWKAIIGERHLAAESDDEKEPATLHGLGISDTLTHGFSGEGGTISLSLCRTVSYATHDPHEIAPEENVRYIDRGEISFRYTLRPLHDGTYPATLNADALVQIAPILTSLESGHGGSPENAGPPLLEITPSTLQVTSLKQSEDQQGIIVRLIEQEGKERSIHVRCGLSSSEWKGIIKPHGCCTLKFDAENVMEVDGLEMKSI